MLNPAWQMQTTRQWTGSAAQEHVVFHEAPYIGSHQLRFGQRFSSFNE
jgi:hypothetical protein